MKQQGAALKLSFLVVVFLVAFASSLSPFIVEARQKHAQHSPHRHHRVKHSPIPSHSSATKTLPTLAPTAASSSAPTTAPSNAPTTAPSSAPTTAPSLPKTTAPTSAPSNDGMTLLPPSESPPTDDGIVNVEPPPNDYHDYYLYAPPGTVRPPPGFVIQHISHGCGYGPCLGENDCDYPCPYCCANYTCCADYELDYRDGPYPGPPGYP